ncbi:MAG: HD-GYP domain-containing protein [Chloroflexota bacterium]|nr:HD-GYP domain-containing protein [Chloroflexota bacterium]
MGLVVLFMLAASGLWITGYRFNQTGGTFGLVTLFLLSIVAGFLEIRIPRSETIAFTVDSALSLSLALILGPLSATALFMAATLVLDLFMRRTPIKILVNVFGLGLATLSAGWVFSLVSSSQVISLSEGRTIAGIMLAATVFTMVNTWSLAIIISAVLGAKPLAMWWANRQPMAIELVTVPTIGSIVPVLYAQHPFAPVLLFVPLLGPFFAFRALRQVEEETRKCMESLADALEQRDPYTSQHSIRVTAHTTAILDQMPEIPFEVRSCIIAAARVHDVGKVGTRDGSLFKPGRLTDAEFLDIQRHPVIGSDIVGQLAIYQDEATLIRHHHERWDGTGYPDRLAGDAIPLGARVIAVADAFDAMTSDRAYRPALAFETALEILRGEAGAQFDPDIVRAFERAIAPAVTATSSRHARQVAPSLITNG